LSKQLRSHDGTHADDHGLNLRLCRRLLETAGGLQVITADDGDVALRILIDSYGPGCEPVDIVLMDMQMPRMDGLAATRAFRAWESRERPPPAQRLPIVVRYVEL
jgi:CheY-like chemotaxis protein